MGKYQFIGEPSRCSGWSFTIEPGKVYDVQIWRGDYGVLIAQVRKGLFRKVRCPYSSREAFEANWRPVDER